jgi:hypothetical protein
MDRLRTLKDALKAVGQIEHIMEAAGTSCCHGRLPKPVLEILQCVLLFKPYLEISNAEILNAGLGEGRGGRGSENVPALEFVEKRNLGAGN